MLKEGKKCCFVSIIHAEPETRKPRFRLSHREERTANDSVKALIDPALNTANPSLFGLASLSHDLAAS